MQGFVEVRVGTDIMRVENVTRSLRDFGTRYLQRIYTRAEVAYCERSAHDMDRRLAGRFAAKEACLKVLRPLQHWLDWRTLEVVRHPGGWCDMVLHGPARQLAETQGIRQLSVALSHEDDYAVAVVSATLWHAGGALLQAPDTGTPPPPRTDACPVPIPERKTP